MSLRDSARNSAWKILRRRKPAVLIPAGEPVRGTAAVLDDDPVATQPTPPEQPVSQHRHTYTSAAYDPEPGQATTAIGYQKAGLLRDPSLDGETTAIGRYGVEQKAARDVEDPPLYREIKAALRRRATLPEPIAEPVAEPVDDEDHDGDAVLLPRLDLNGGGNRG